MNEDLLQGFNPSQRAAVEYCDGPSLVIAGAGSGKTRVLTYKIAYLMRLGLRASSILALTFTNKAADEMKERVASIVGTREARYLWMGTFHSVFLRILRAEYVAIGFKPNFTVYDATDSKNQIKGIIKDLELDDKVYKPSAVQSRISRAKNQLVTAQEYASNPNNAAVDARSNMARLGEIFLQYSERCRRANVMDFDDILLYTYKLFCEHEEIRRRYVERFDYVLVDEYQDTNRAQDRIVWQLTHDKQRVCVVGDDAQSIYSFRGADIDNILNFTNTYSDCRLFKLEQNYRSTQYIVDAANSLIRKNQLQIPKDVFSEKEKGEPLTLVNAYSDIDEAESVTRRIWELKSKEGLEYSDFAILYRTNAQSRVLEEMLRKKGMPYSIYGGLSFYQRKEVKDVIAYFRMIVNPDDEEAFKRIINYPARGIGSTTLGKIQGVADKYGVSLWTVINEPLRYGLNMNRNTVSKIGAFRDLIAGFMDLAETADAKEAGERIIRESGIYNDILQDKTPEGEGRKENLDELINGLADFCELRMEEGNENVSLSDYLTEVSLISDIDSMGDDDEPKVTLMTIHSAKGLEFHTVFVVGLEENLFPNLREGENLRAVEEERRLFYVAITRAKRHCYLSCAKSRLRYGQMEFSVPSRFIRDIDPQYLDMGSSVRSAGRKPASALREVRLPWKEKEQPRPAIPETRRLRPVTAPLSHGHNAASEDVTTPLLQGADNKSVRVGQRIEHERFGCGTVNNVEGRGENVKITVAFDSGSVKQLLIKFARFKILG